MELDDAVGGLVEAIAASARGALRCEVAVVPPGALGFVASAPGVSARLLSLWAPNGASRVLGLLPRVGAYEPRMVVEPGEPPLRPRVITVGPDFVVTAARPPRVAMTLEAKTPFLSVAERALAVLEPYGVGRSWPAGRGVLEATRYPRYLALDVEPPGPPDLDPAWAAGIDAVVWRACTRGDAPGLPHVVVRSPARSGDR